MLYMVIEWFREGYENEVYERARMHGRMLPNGLDYLDSWVTPDLRMCYQLMRCNDEGLLHEWMENWKDLVEFETTPVLTAIEASEVAVKRAE